MGLSASQARLLTITSRLSDLELRAQNISNSKIRLSQESGEVSKAYAQALDKETYQMLTNSSGSTNTYSDVTYDTLMDPDVAKYSNQYCLTNNSGKILVDNKTANDYVNAAGDVNKFLEKYNAKPTITTVYDSGYAAAQTAFAAKELAYLGADKTGNTSGAKFNANKALETLNTYGTAYVEGYSAAGAWTRSEQSTKSFTTSYKDSDIYTYLTKNCKDGNNNTYKTDGSSNVIMVTQTELYGLNGKFSTVLDKMDAYVNNICDDVAAALTNTFSSTPLNGNAKITQAIGIARNLTVGYYTGDVFDENMYEDDAYSTEKNAKKAAANGNGIGVDYGSLIFGGTDKIYLDQSQVVKTFLNYFDGACGRLNNISGLEKTCQNRNGNDETAATRGASGGIGTSNSVTYETKTYNSTDDATGIKDIKYKQTTDSAGKDVATTYKSCLSDYSNKKGLAKTASDEYEAARTQLNGQISTTSVKSQNTDYYTNLYARMGGGTSKNYFTMDENKENSTINNSDWISAQIQNGGLNLEKVENGTWTSTSWSSDTTNFTTEEDDAAIAKAEAEYDSDMNEIQTKDKRLDLELKNIDTEHSALQTEKESVATIINKNIERSFKMFDA